MKNSIKSADKPYVGLLRSGKRETFLAAETPTEKEFGSEYFAVIGPFKTKKAAIFMALYGNGNPHLQCVADAERVARGYRLERNGSRIVAVKNCNPRSL